MRKLVLNVCSFVGKKTIFWYFLSILAAFTIAFIELGIASFLQLFLITLGVISNSAKISGGLSGVHFTPIQIALFLLVIGVLKGISQFIVGQGSTIANESVKARLHLLNLYEMLQREKLSFVSSSLANYRMSEIFPKSAVFCSISSQLVALTVQCLGLATLLIFTSWQEALIGLTGLVIIGVIVYYINLNVRQHSRKTPLEQAAIMGGIARITRNWLFIRLKRTEKKEYQKISKNTISYAMHSIRASFWGQFGTAIPPILGIILVVALILYSLHHPQEIGLKFISFLYLFIRLVQNLGSLAALFGEINITYPQFKEALQYFSKFSKEEVNIATESLTTISSFGREKLVERNLLAHKSGGQEVKLANASPPDILIDNLHFKYNNQFIFKGLSCKIKAGSIFGIAGRSGTGKSTLLALILGMLEPSEGNIKINSFPSKQFFENSSTRVGYVGAEPFLIEGSIRDNILYGWEGLSFSDADIKEALRKAHLLDVIENLKTNFNYKLTENGEGLSAGQKQRLCIARALLGKPQLLILDEASANLDDKTEGEIVKTILELKEHATVIIVSHRIGMLEIAETRITLDEEIPNTMDAKNSTEGNLVNDKF